MIIAGQFVFLSCSGYIRLYVIARPADDLMRIVSLKLLLCYFVHIFALNFCVFTLALGLSHFMHLVSTVDVTHFY